MTNKTYSPNHLIPFLSKEQKQILQKLFGHENLEKLDLETALNKKINPLDGIFSKKLIYNDILVKVLNHLNIKTNSVDSITAEKEIIKYQFQKTYDNLTDEEKKKFDDEIESIALKNGISSAQFKSLGVVGTLLTANASGFGLYIMASTIVGSVSSILGITLPFAFYTGMSSVLSFITGPIGITIGLAIFAISIRHENPESLKQKFNASLKTAKSFFTSDFEFAIGAITYLGACRQIILQETNKRLVEVNNEVNSLKRDNSTLEIRNQAINQEIVRLKNELSNNTGNISANENLLTEREIETFALETKLKHLE